MIILISLMFASPSFAPPVPPVIHGSEEDEPAGGGAPVGEGTGLLILAAGAYTWFRNRKRETEE